MRESIRPRHVVAVALGVAMLMAPAVAGAQLTVTAPARSSTLGAIPIPPTPGGCATKVVSFDVAGVDIVRAVRVSIGINYFAPLGYLGAVLTDPGGRAFAILPQGGVFGPAVPSLGGTYTFSDGATTTWYAAVVAAGIGGVASGTYRTTDTSGTTSVLDDAFADRLATGTWTLTFNQCFYSQVGNVSAASLTVVGNAGTEVNATPSTLGAIPDATSCPQQPGVPRDVSFVVPSGRGPVLSIRLSMTIAHQSTGDLVARLIAPTGQSHVLFGYTGASGAQPAGSATDLNGTYEFLDGVRGNPWWANVIYGTNPVASGLYNTSELGGPGATGLETLMDPVFAGVPSAGVWTLRLTDGCSTDTGAISAAHLLLETLATPTAITDAYTTVYPAALVVAAPGVLGNDQSNLGTGITAELVSPPAHGTLTLQSSGAFTYAPAIGYLGDDSFVYRADSTQGAGTTATVSITVAAPTTVQAPFGLTAFSIQGNEVTLRWQVPPGPVPADYVLEGGIAPGQTLGAVAVGGPQPVLTFPAPTGVFFVRVHAITNGQRSGPSNEIRIAVNVPEAPSTPAGLTGFVNGSQLGLAWKNTFAGGAPQGLQMTVTGAATGAIALPLGESFTFPGVPPGSYTFRVRALNASGASVESSPVTLTFPSGCSGAPMTPSNFLAYAVGNVVRVMWDPAPSGAAASGYVLQVTGSFTGSLPLPDRIFRAPAPSGAYALSVVAVNPCGASVPTAAQTVFVP